MSWAEWKKVGNTNFSKPLDVLINEKHATLDVDISAIESNITELNNRVKGTMAVASDSIKSISEVNYTYPSGTQLIRKIYAAHFGWHRVKFFFNYLNTNNSHCDIGIKKAGEELTIAKKTFEYPYPSVNYMDVFLSKGETYEIVKYETLSDAMTYELKLDKIHLCYDIVTDNAIGQLG